MLLQIPVLMLWKFYSVYFATFPNISSISTLPVAASGLDTLQNE